MRSCLVVALSLALALPAIAQTVSPPKAGDFGIHGSISTTSNSVGAVWHVADHVVLMPEIGFYTWKYTVSQVIGVPSPEYSGAWYHVGFSAYWDVNLSRTLSIDFGPAVYYNRSPNYQNLGDIDTYDWNSWGLRFDLVPKVFL